MSNHQGNLKELAERPVGRLLYEYSLPAVVGMVTVSLYNVIDRVFIGHQVGADAIAGLAITFPVMNLATALGVLVGAGSAARVSILLGQKRTDLAQRVLGNALTLTLIIGFIYVSLFAVFLDDILRAFGASEHTLPYAHDFMYTLLPGLLLTNLTYGFNNIQRASGYPRRAMMAMLLSAGVNFVFAYLFIFPLNMGIRGAALATDIAMFSAMLFVFLHFMRKESTVHFTKGIYRLDKRTVLSIISIGAAPSLVNIAGCLINVIINKSLVFYGGDNAVGAAGIFTTFTQLICMVVLGICQGMQPIIGYNYGAGLYHRLKKTFWLAVGVSSVFCVVGSIAGLTVPRFIAKIFTYDESLINATVNCLTIALMAFSVVGFQIVSTTLFQSIGKAGKSIVLSLARQVIFLIPLLLWLPGMFNLDGIWMAFPCSDLLATAVTAVMVIYQFRQFRKISH
jgi:putative MATE family efflux protein